MEKADRRHEIAQQLQRVEQAIANYEELDSDMESPEYVARGNGFCDSKYSEDFIEGQLATLRMQRDILLKELEAAENPIDTRIKKPQNTENLTHRTL